jgi:lipid II:glycine glycyltransferase (peptidoglycan interpeptide bridge formation enzyme)
MSFKLLTNKAELENLQGTDCPTEHYLQSQAWCETLDKCTIGLSYDNNEFQAKSLLTYRKSPFNIANFYTIDRGPVAISTEALISHINQLVDHLKSSNAVFIRCSPLAYDNETIKEITTSLKNNGWTPVATTLALYKNTLTIDLSKPIEEIKRNFRRSLKTQINKSEKLGIEVSMSPDAEQMQQFYTYFNQMACDRGILPINKQTQRFINSEIYKNNAKALLAYVDSKLLSGVILIKQGDRVIYEWGMNTQDPDYKNFPLAHKLHWEGIKWAKDNNYKYYDFGGFWLDYGNENPINYFKLGFTKNISPVTPEFYYILKPFRFWLFQTAQRIRKALKQ